MNEQTEMQNQTNPEPAADPTLRYMTDEERREWSGLPAWKDPLEKEQIPADASDGRMALASLLLGIAAVLTITTGYANAVFGAAAVITGIVSKKKPETADTMSTAGIVLGIIGLGTALTYLVIWKIYKSLSEIPLSI